MMEFVALDVENFGRVARARVAFKPGLNVLYGANEVGKSSIARAIRFALLLPSASGAASPWVPWEGGGDPTVTLTLKVGPTELYRVKKIFGTTTATLERSSDGVRWTSVARAREVEGRLRTLLQWGIPEPGAGGPRGVPHSFLAGALLADQDAVSEIFERGLEEDTDDSGRSRIRAALQALAQDPLFKAVLDAAQARVDEAFTATGQRRRGANDPFKRIAEEMTARSQEYEQAEKEAETARLLAAKVSELQHQVAQAEMTLEDAMRRRQSLEQRRDRQGRLAVATAQRRRAQACVDGLKEAEEKARAAEAICSDLEPRMPGLRTSEELARRALETAALEASALRDKRRAALSEEETAILRERETLRVKQAAVLLVQGLREAAALEAKANEVRDEVIGLETEISLLGSVEGWLDLQAAIDLHRAAEKREALANAYATAAAEHRARAALEWPGPHSHLLPDARRLDELRKLRSRLDLAEGKLDVGLSVEVRGGVPVSLVLDGRPVELSKPPVTMEASRSAHLHFSDGTEVLVRGGRPTDREDAEQYRRLWTGETAAMFAAVGVGDLATLEEMCRLDAERHAASERLTREAIAADTRREALANVTSEKLEHAAKITELQGRLEGVDLDRVKVAAETHSARVRMILARKAMERDSKRDEVAGLQARVTAMRAEAATVDGATVVDLDVEEQRLKTVATELQEREKKLAEERKSVDSKPAAHATHLQAAASAKLALDSALADLAEATHQRDVWTALLGERREAASGVDIESLVQAEEAARAASRDDGAAVAEAEIQDARSRELSATRRHDDLSGELRESEGALHASGGAAAEERLRDLEVAVERTREKQRGVEDDYEAWKLLTETLKEAESTEATHLGNVLAPDLAARFQALAGPRYGGVSLGPHLGLDGIEAGGARRELGRLSIGTREQLSTLLRLCLAERLQSALLLDDQLVQSDPDRIRWFRNALRQTAATGVQVVVLTCRPDDYLELAESPAPNVIDLAGVVT